MSQYSTQTGSFLARLMAMLLGALLGASAARAQSGDPSMDPPMAASGSAQLRPRPVRTEGVRTLDGLERHARIQAVVSPRRIAPGERGVVHVILEAHEGRALGDLRIAVRAASGSGVESMSTGAMPVDEQATARVVPVPVTFSSALLHGHFDLEVEVVADVRHLVDHRSMGRWRTVVKTAAQLGAPLPKPVPRRAAGARLDGGVAGRGLAAVASDRAVEVAAGDPDGPRFRDSVPLGTRAPKSTISAGGWMARWGWLLTLLAPLVVVVLIIRWLLGAQWWAAEPRSSR